VAPATADRELEHVSGAGRMTAPVMDVEGTVVPVAAEARQSRRGFMLGGSAAIVLAAAIAWFALGSGRLPPAAPGEPAAGSAADHAAVVPAAGMAAHPGDTNQKKVAATHVVSPSNPDPATHAPPQEVADALALSSFFLDRGEYDSAVEELERALRAAPDNDDLKRALAAAQKAQAAEAAVLGADR